MPKALTDKVRPTQAKAIIRQILKSKRPIWLWGPPGVGKSSILRQLATEMSINFVDLRVALLMPPELLGVPYTDETIDYTIWKPPIILPREGKGILVLEELAQADELSQAAVLQLALDRRLGSYQLPDDYVVVAASNRFEDRAGVHSVITPLLDRFFHLEIETHIDDWFEYAWHQKIIPQVRSFLKFRPELLLKFDSNSMVWPNPRSWEFVSDVYPHLNRLDDINLLQIAIAGKVGAGAAREFVGYLEMFDRLPKISAILKDPTGFAIPEEPGVVYALCVYMADRIRSFSEEEKRKKWVKPAAAFLTRLLPEYTVFSLRDLISAEPSALKLPVVDQWILDHQELFESQEKYFIGEKE